MSAILENLRICGNVLCADNYTFFALRCAECDASFGQWTSFIRHLQHNHAEREVLKNEWDSKPEECFDDIKGHDIKNEVESIAANNEEMMSLESLNEFKDETELGEDNEVIFEEHLKEDETDEEDTFEEASKEDDSAVATTSKKSDKDDGKLKTFYFNLNDNDWRKTSLELLKKLETQRLLWDYKHENYRNPKARTEALTKISNYFLKKGYNVNDTYLRRILPTIYRDYKKAKQEMAINGNLEQRWQLLYKNAQFLDGDEEEKVRNVNNWIGNDGEAADAHKDEDSDSSNGSIGDPEMLYKNNGRFKRFRFHVHPNKLVTELIGLIRENPLLWDITRPDYNNSYDRKHIIESWVPLFKERQGIAFTYDELAMNLRLFRRYHSALQHRKQINAAAIYIREECAFLPVIKRTGRIQCEHCDNFFQSENNYKAHLHAVHKIGTCPFRCEECDKDFTSMYLLDVHKRVNHIRQYDFPCNICGKRFLRKYDLIFHTHVHTGEKTFICETCGKGFRRRLNLKNHEIRIHLRQRNFACEMCPKAFYTKALLRDHVNAHLNIRNFKCPHCGKGFHSSHALMRHKQIHSEVKRYACKLCDARFHQFVGLNSHMKNRHRFVQAKNEGDSGEALENDEDVVAASEPAAVAAVSGGEFALNFRVN